MSRSSKVMLLVTVFQGVNCALYLWHTASAPSGGRFAVLAFAFVGFFWVLYVLVKGVKLDKRIGG